LLYDKIRCFPLVLFWNTLFSAFLCVEMEAQILTESILPIVIIESEEDYIPDDPKMDAIMGIIDHGPGMLNHIDDVWNHYAGNIAIETRGNSTQGFDKKSYLLETRDGNNDDISFPILGMGADEDWILHAMVIDKTQLRIPMSFYLFQQMGHYASNWRYVELVINGEYRGLYLLCERIKRDNDRVDISKLDADDIAGDSLTGGYILRIDWLWDAEGFESEYDAMGGDNMIYQWYYPKADRIEDEQADYIEKYIGEFEDAVFDDDYVNDLGRSYTDYIDLVSFADFLLINEFAKNSDGYKLSTYMHKDRDDKGGKLTAGPIWDFDQTYGLSTVCSSHITEGWTYLQEQDGCEDIETMPMWWRRLMDDPVFTNLLACRWEKFRSEFLAEEEIFSWMNEHQTKIKDAIERNYTQWDDVIGEGIWIEPWPIPESYEEEIQVMKDWITDRLEWLDENIPGNCDDNIISSNEDISLAELLVFPNPASDQVYIHSHQGARIEMYDLQGSLKFAAVMSRDNESFDLVNMTDGVYVVRSVFAGQRSQKLMFVSKN